MRIRSFEQKPLHQYNKRHRRAENKAKPGVPLACIGLFKTINKDSADNSL